MGTEALLIRVSRTETALLTGQDNRKVRMRAVQSVVRTNSHDLMDENDESGSREAHGWDDNKGGAAGLRN